MSTKSLKVRLAVAGAVGATVLALASPAFAGGKGGNKPTGGGSGSTMTLVIVASSSTDGNVHQGDTITWHLSTSTSQPHVSVSCSQNGTVVYSTQTGYYASYPWPWTQDMTLASGAWTSGAADCSARLYSLSNSGNSTTLATSSFHVYA